MQKREKEDMRARTLTDDDLARIYGGANGGNQSSPAITNMSWLAKFLPQGMPMPDFSKMSSSPSGNDQSTVPSPSGGSSGGSGGGLPLVGPLLGGL